MSRRTMSMDQTTVPGWDGELMDLQRETQQLLASVRSPQMTHTTRRDRRSGGGRGNGGDEKKVAKTKRRKRAKEADGRTTLKNTLKKQQHKMGTGRETVEVLDTLSNPVSARESDDEDIEDEALVARTAGAGFSDGSAGAETTARNLNFDTEENRVREELDTFVPRSSGGLATGLSKLDQERQRLERINARKSSQRMGREDVVAEVEARRAWLEDDRTALTIQRLYRGHLGRRRVALIHDSAAAEKAVREAWVEVRDEESGDVWFFNQETGESQWEMPSALLELVPSGDRVKKLPPLVPSPAKADPSRILSSTGAAEPPQQALGRAHSQSSLPVMGGGTGQLETQRPRSSGSSSSSFLPDITRGASGGSQRRELFRDGVTDYEDEEIGAGVEGGIHSSGDTRRLFLADGSKNAMLRDTVRDTLKVSRFDSVATLLMGPSANAEPQQGQEEDGSSSNPLHSAANSEHRHPVIGDGARGSKQSMVSVLKVSKESSKKSRPAVGGSAAASVKGVKSLAIRDVKHPGFDLDVPGTPSGKGKRATSAKGKGGGGSKPDNSVDVSRVNEICFNCWSAGKGKYCALHVNDERLQSSKGEGSALMCKNWNLGVLLKRYRSEDIQEIFMKSAASLRYDKQRKRFVTVEEQKHPIYRGLSTLLERYNFTVRRKIHQAVWLRSLVEELRTGKIHTEGAAHSARMLRLRNTLLNSCWVRQYASSVAHLHPKGPVTGTTLMERRGLVHHLVIRGEHSYMFALPLPMPLALYLPRKYDLPAPRSIPMPRPSYKAAPPVVSPNTFIDEAHPASWLERFVARVSREAMSASALQVAALSPLPGLELLRRTKYASPQTIKFAAFARKPTPGNLAVGGLAAELTVHELVQTVVPPQFGNYTVMHKTAVAPALSAEATASFDPRPKDVAMQVFVLRPLQHPLNSRRPPTIMVPTSATEFEKHFYGPNRPEQTGEEHPHGFRTSAFASGCDAIVVKETNVQAFEPSAEVSTPNLPAANQTVTTHVDHTYPFCEPSNRNNTTLDFYHLLLFGTCAPNKEQVFTNLGTQECGEFMRETDIDRPMGPCLSSVYRSWAFVQRQMIEEFVTDDGLPYWFDRKTGETFWERPLAPEEKVPVKEGGTVLDYGTPSDAEARAEDTKKKYRQDDIRKVILKKHESADEMLDRRKLAAQSAKWAREEGVIKAAKRKKKKNQQPQQQQQSSSSFAPAGSSSSSNHQNPSMSGPTPVQQTSAPGGGGCGGGMSGSCGVGAGGAFGMVDYFAQPPNNAAPQPGGDAVASLTTALSGLLPQLQGSQPMDLLQLGMGLGMSLQQQGGGGAAQSALQLGNNMNQMGGGEFSPGVTFSENQTMGLQPPAPGAAGAEPIGQVDPTVSSRTATLLDHTLEAAQQESLAQINPTLSTVEQYRGMAVVEVTETPDEEVEGHVMHISREAAASKQVPVFAYPDEFLGKDYSTHGLAGAGVSFVPEGQGADQQYVQESKRALRRAGDVLPEGFFNAIYSTHVGKAEVDYLPSVPNLPMPRPVGRVKPRSAAEDWFAIGFDPWSAGKDPLTREFIPTLLTKEQALLEQARKRSDAAFIDIMDKDGQGALAAESSESQRLQAMFDELASYARHSKYREIEEAMNQPDFNMPVDFQDDAGNTLLHVTAQNGLKRIAKLLLRRGASINKQNLAGQTVLHYCQAYGFTELFDYFMSKGADDNLKNADELTCYEGLSADDVNAI